MVWADGMRDNLERSHTHNLEDYYQWICREAKPEIHSKLSSYQWLMTTGQELSEMTTGKERKEFTKVSKEVKAKWDGLNEALEKRKAKVSHLLQVSSAPCSRFRCSCRAGSSGKRTLFNSGLSCKTNDPKALHYFLILFTDPAATRVKVPRLYEEVKTFRELRHSSALTHRV
jgi:hypothetical protein